MEFQNSIWREYHNSSKDKAKGHPNIPLDSDTWPESWKKVTYTSYARLPTLALPSPAEVSERLTESLEKRSSHRTYTREPTTLQDLSTLLYWACGKHEDSDLRRYPSGGGVYPIETYLINFSGSEEYPAGLYHYNIRTHNLSCLWKRTFEDGERKQMFGYPWAEDASVAVIFTIVFDRVIEKYGERAYRFALLEAGHIAQNFSLVATALSLKSCLQGGMNDAFLETLFNFDSHKESIVYGLILGS